MSLYLGIFRRMSDQELAVTGAVLGEGGHFFGRQWLCTDNIFETVHIGFAVRCGRRFLIPTAAGHLEFGTRPEITKFGLDKSETHTSRLSIV